MNKSFLGIFLIAALAGCVVPEPVPAPTTTPEVQIETETGPVRMVSVAEYCDRMSGGWMGRSIGVTYGALVGVRTNCVMLAEDELPVWKSELINGTFDYPVDVVRSGIFAPGLPQVAGGFEEPADACTNRCCGACAARFVAAMYASAFFTSDHEEIVETSLKCIPEGSEFAGVVRDVLVGYRANTDLSAVWSNAVARCQGKPAGSLDGAMTLLAFLYGAGDMDQTMRIAARCGTDCARAAAEACGVLGVTLGLKAIPPKYHKDFDRSRKWKGCDLDYAGLLGVSEKLAHGVVVKFGGRIEKDESESEWFVVPVTPVIPKKPEAAPAAPVSKPAKSGRHSLLGR